MSNNKQTIHIEAVIDWDALDKRFSHVVVDSDGWLWAREMRGAVIEQGSYSHVGGFGSDNLQGAVTNWQSLIFVRPDDNTTQQEKHALSTSTNDVPHKLKPFDAQAAMQGVPVCTRDGKSVRILCIDAPCTHCGFPQPVIGIITGNDFVSKWSLDGRFTPMTSVEFDNDLFMAPQKRSGWINVYKQGFVSEIYPTAESAVPGRTSVYGGVDSDFIDCIEIHWEE